MKKRVGALLAALLSCALIVIGGSAFAAGSDEAAPELGNIDFTQPRSLTVHKYVNPAFGPAGDGTQDPNAPVEGKLSGVDFSIAKVNELDLTNPADWAKVKDLTVVDGQVPGYTLGAATTQATVNGETTFAGLEPGVYLVTEGADHGDNKITRPAAPFLVTVPFPNASGWIYDVHAYPKNSVTDIDKTVDDSITVGGQGADAEVLNWTVTVTVPNETQALESFIISDTFDARLAYLADPGVTVPGFAAGDYDVVQTGQTVDVVFTAAGLTKLDQMKGEKVSVTFPTHVLSPGTDGIIPNTATVYVNDPNKVNGHKSIPPETPWGEVIISKFEQGTTKVLKDAEFTIYRTAADAQAGTNPVTTMVTGADGTASKILHEGTYYLKETKAPAGFVLSDEVHEVVINTDATQGPVQVTVNLEIPNVKSDVPDLPLTGAAGRILLMIGGAALILLAIGSAAVAKRRRS